MGEDGRVWKGDEGEGDRDGRAGKGKVGRKGDLDGDDGYGNGNGSGNGDGDWNGNEFSAFFCTIYVLNPTRTLEAPRRR